MICPPSVLLTGAASGIGRATALLLAGSGWHCVLVDRDADGLAQLMPQLQAHSGIHHLARVVDLTDADAIEALAAGLPELDAMIHNAGISDTSGTALTDQPASQLQRVLDLNLRAPQRLTTACLPLLRPGGRIVNVASGAGLQAIPWRGAYSPSKAGLIALTQALAAARPDLVVNVLCPGFVRTELVESLIAAGRLDPAEAVSKIPLGRMADPPEMAHVLRFLAGQGAAPLRGQVVAVNGGSSLYGGSRRLPPATLAPLALDLPLSLRVEGHQDAAWVAMTSTEPAGVAEQGAYPAVLDLTPLTAPAGELWRAVHASAARFAQRHPAQASLTLLLPVRQTADWTLASDAAAARMLVATLACEWGPRQLRINALQVPDFADPGALGSLVHFVAGAGAQYLTGQTLSVT